MALPMDMGFPDCPTDANMLANLPLVDLRDRVFCISKAADTMKVRFM